MVVSRSASLLRQLVTGFKPKRNQGKSWTEGSRHPLQVLPQLFHFTIRYHMEHLSSRIIRENTARSTHTMMIFYFSSRSTPVRRSYLQIPRD